jgi:hypothetical protein
VHDQAFGCFAIITVVAVIIAVALWESRSTQRRRERVLSWLAPRWNGRVIEGGFLYEPRLRIQVEDVAGEVTFQAKGGRNSRSSWTKVHFDWRSPRRLRVTPQGFTGWLRSVFGGADILVGRPEFDNAFWIESADPAWSRQVLSPLVQDRFLALRESPSIWSGDRVVTLDAGASGLVLKVDLLLVDDQAGLERFVDLAALILAAAIGPDGIVLAAVETVASSECPVCGHAVEGGGHPCPRCSTPHHEDCWKYSGGCAIFACAARPRKAV